MCNIESVVLKYKKQYRMEFQYYAEFLRYIGIYVCEDFRSPENENGEFLYEKSICSARYEIKEEIDFGNKADKIKRLQIFVKKIYGFDSIEETWIDDLITVYVNNELLQASVTLQYFRMKDEKLVLEAGKSFGTAADQLVALVNVKGEYWDQRNVRYAKLYCKQKMNYAQYLYNKTVIYYIDKLAIEGLSILKNFPEFSNVWVLLGMIYEDSKDFVREAIDAYKRAIEMVATKPFASSIHYWLGKILEKDKTLEGGAEKSYLNAYTLMKKYRNIYKLANYNNRRNTEDALKYFKECIAKIEEKESYLDPLELEYYYKVCVQMSTIYLKQKDYIKAIVFANNAVKLRDNLEKGKDIPNQYTAFYFDMYKDKQPTEYINLTIKRMGLKNAYHNMAVACGEYGFQEEAEIYWELYRKYL